MNTKQILVAATLVGVSAGGIAVAAATPRHSPQPTTSQPPFTPNDCIRLNGGDYNACNVGNSGRGDLPYTIAEHRTPNDCIRLNGGDYNACNVGNSGRGDLPYLRVPAH